MDEQISKLTELLNAISIEEEPQQTPLYESEEEKIVYDYSDDENPYMALETGESSNTGQPFVEQKRPRYNDYMNSQGYVKTEDGKISRFTPRTENITDTLNLDCCIDPLETITTWSNKIRLAIQIDSTLFEKMSEEDVVNFVRYKTEGVAFNFMAYMNFRRNSPGEVWSATRILDAITAILVEEFVGTKAKDNEDVSNKAIYHLVNLRICNMCFFEQYICEFRLYYYKINLEKRPETTSLFFAKLPEQVSLEVSKKFEADLQQGFTVDTLGGRISTLQKYMMEKCNAEKAKQQTQVIKLCCPPTFSEK